MFGKKVRKIYILHSVENDVKDLAVAVFSTKRKAKKYFEHVMKSFRDRKNNVCYDENRNRHYVECGENTFVWYIESGDILDRKFNSKAATITCTYL